ncbi:MAG: putative sporulation protein YtxC [Clostridium perfringens]|nr:putative sporulation protein YtxC [Clostridium perfringens]
MLLMKLAYEGEETFVNNIQEVRELLKNKGVIVGISESIEKDTHFVKIFCDDKDYTEKLQNNIYLYISNLIYKIIMESFRDREMLEYLTENYFFLNHEEIIDVDNEISKVIFGRNIIKDETSVYCLNRINLIIENIKSFLVETGYININGFIRFRMKAMINTIEEIVDKVVERYMVEKEYNEFVKLLKYFVEIQECKIEEIDLKVLNNGLYEIKNGSGEDVFKDFLREVKDNTEDSVVNVEDIIISGLITNAPKKIRIFNEVKCNNKEFLNTIKSVFGERVEVCK